MNLIHIPEEKQNNDKNTYNKWMKLHKTVTNKLLNHARLDREDGRTVGSGRVATIIE